MKKIIYSFIGFILGCAVAYITLYKKPPNSQHIKVKKDIVDIPHAKLVNTITTHVSLTVYQPVKNQCDSDPLTTSDGSKINLRHLKSGKIKWCAISQDLLYLFPKGKPKMIFIDGYGLYEVRDIMNKRHKHKVDLLIHPKNSMRIKIKNVKIKILL